MPLVAFGTASSFRRFLGPAIPAMLAAILLAAAWTFQMSIVIVSGNSMGSTAPAGSLVIAYSAPSETVGVGDIVVVREVAAIRPRIHRVIEVTDGPGGRAVITKGDANATPDALPFVLDTTTRVSVLAVPVVGSFVIFLATPVVRGILALFVVFGLLGSLAARRRAAVLS